MSYSEAFMGTGRKQTDVEKLAEDVALYQAWAAKFGSTSPSVCINKLLDLLAEASEVLESTGKKTKFDNKQKELVIYPNRRIADFLTRIAPLVKQHRGGDGQAPSNGE